MPPPLLKPGQRRLAPPGALGVGDAGSERQLVAAGLADAEGVEKRLRVPVVVDEAQHLMGDLPPSDARGFEFTWLIESAPISFTGWNRRQAASAECAASN